MEGGEMSQSMQHVQTGKRLAVMDKKAQAFPPGFKKHSKECEQLSLRVCRSLMTPFIHKMH